jgi:glycosyltransferase involved in cell wall biosynthesis
MVGGIEQLDGKTRVAILVNSAPRGPLAPRARALAHGLVPDFAVEVLWRRSTRAKSILQFVKDLRGFRPHVLYLLDVGYPIVLAAGLYQALRPCRLVIDTGDALAELLWTTGRVGRIGRHAARVYESVALGHAQQVVVRSSGLKEYLRHHGIHRVHVVPDGVDASVFHPMEVSGLRQALGIEAYMSIGVMSSLNWSSRLEWGPGCELIDALTLLKNLAVCGLVIGDGPGREILERRAKNEGLEERIRFLGHIPYDALPTYISAMDICLSTQTNDWVGRARTTGKLPLFLACGRFILASRVGEAARVLPDEMLVDYREGFDPTYGERLARRIERVVRDPQLLALGKHSRRVAETEFDYGVLVPRVARVLRSVLEPNSPLV